MLRRSIAMSVAAAAAACSSSGATGPRTAAPASTAKSACVVQIPAGPHTFAVASGSRRYRVALPSGGLANRPLLVAIHGFASSAAQFDRETGFERAGTRRGYVVLTPDAAGSPTNWNLFAAKGQPDDYGFVDALVAAVVRSDCVDPGRVYVAGHSAGSAFSGFLVCRKPYRYAAVAMVSATVPSTCPPRVTPAVISVHGTADPIVPYAGGLGIGQTVPIPPVRETIAQLAKARSCTPTPTDTRVAPHVVRRSFRNCAHGKDVELFTIEGGGHLWSPDSTARILDFFDGHPAR